MCGSKCCSHAQVPATSSRPLQTPVAKPARKAAPTAVVSIFLGRSTGITRTCARNWHSHAFAAIPPSTRMAACGRGTILRHRLGQIEVLQARGRPPSAARAKCAPVASSVSPTYSLPCAFGSQCGAPRPTNAGTMITPWPSGTRVARLSVSVASAITPKTVAQPFDRGAGNENRAFERIGCLTASAGTQAWSTGDAPTPPAALARCSPA